MERPPEHNEMNLILAGVIAALALTTALSLALLLFVYLAYRNLLRDYRAACAELDYRKLMIRSSRAVIEWLNDRCDASSGILLQAACQIEQMSGLIRLQGEALEAIAEIENHQLLNALTDDAEVIA
jgi:hypothetical protein